MSDTDTGTTDLEVPQAATDMLIACHLAAEDGHTPEAMCLQSIAAPVVAARLRYWVAKLPDLDLSALLDDADQLDRAQGGDAR